jgi:hypothetical protein
MRPFRLCKGEMTVCGLHCIACPFWTIGRHYQKWCLLRPFADFSPRFVSRLTGLEERPFKCRSILGRRRVHVEHVSNFLRNLGPGQNSQSEHYLPVPEKSAMTNRISSSGGMNRSNRQSRSIDQWFPPHLPGLATL